MSRWFRAVVSMPKEILVEVEDEDSKGVFNRIAGHFPGMDVAMCERIDEHQVETMKEWAYAAINKEGVLS